MRCNLCGEDHYKVLYKIPQGSSGIDRNYLIAQDDIVPPEQIVRCLRCGLVYANPRKEEGEILSQYKKLVDESYIREEKGRRISAKIVLKKIRQYKKRDSRLLEIGCATGFFLDEAKNEGWDVYGVEISKWASRYTRESFKFNIFCGQIGQANFPPLYFDAIILNDTLEHLIDPKGIFIKIRRLLKPDGILYISTPNIGSVVSRIWRDKWWGLNQYHIYYFNKASLNHLLDAAGYKPIKWGRGARIFTFSYWQKKLEGYNKKVFGTLRYLASSPLLKDKFLKIKVGDQIEVMAKRKRLMTDLEEIERDSVSHKLHGKIKVVVVLPAYNAGKTLHQTVKDIPRDVVDEIILVDDASQDETVTIARELGLTTFCHDRNKGYGANQKTCYTKALERGADIIVMVHPDYQYDPKVIPEMITPIQEGAAQAVFGSRMLKGGALEGGMPLWKHNCNVTFTALANVILGTYLTEYHSGFRAYSAELLRSIRFLHNSDDFVFDTEIIIQILHHYFKIDEIPIRTRYFEEALVITKWKGFWYGVRILKTFFKYILYKRGLVKFIQFE